MNREDFNFYTDKMDDYALGQLHERLLANNVTESYLNQLAAESIGRRLDKNNKEQSE